MATTTKIRTKHSEIWLDEEDMLIVQMDNDIELDLEEVKASFEVYAALGYGNGHKALQLILSQEESSSMPADARKYAAERAKEYFIASAVVGQSLAVRLVVNFFNAFYKRQIPFRMFETEEAARAWLRQFKAQL
jgi:hypothetical protein